MLSAANLEALDQAGMGFIVGSRMAKTPADLAAHFRWHGDALVDGQVIDTITVRHGATSKEHDTGRSGRADLGPPRVPGVVAGPLGLQRQEVRTRQQDPDRSGEPGAGGGRWRQASEGHQVRHRP